METLDFYMKQIRERGDVYGGSGGTLDLLTWCGKFCTRDVTLEEAKLFFENPSAPCPLRENGQIK